MKENKISITSTLKRSNSIIYRHYMRHLNIFHAYFFIKTVKDRVVSMEIELEVIKKYCLPLLTYCIGALDLKLSDVIPFKICWNDVFRKFFGYRRYDSVKQLHYFCNELPFNYIYDLARWHFCDTIKNKIVFLSEFFDMIECENLTNDKLNQMYKPVSRSYNRKRHSVFNHFFSLQSFSIV